MARRIVGYISYLPGENSPIYSIIHPTGDNYEEVIFVLPKGWSIERSIWGTAAFISPGGRGYDPGEILAANRAGKPMLKYETGNGIRITLPVIIEERNEQT